MKKLSLLFPMLCLSVFGGYSMNVNSGVKAAERNILYELTFEDASNLGKNTSGTLSDATVHVSDNHVKQIKRTENNNAIFLDGGTSFQNYLELPTEMFDGAEAVTIAGWFYHPTGAVAYEGEIGIFSPENNKAFRTDSYAVYHDNCYLYVFGNTECFKSHIYPVYDAWYHMAYTISGGKVQVFQNGYFVKEFTTNLDNLSALHSATSHFYLGQSAYETDHPDFFGGFDDFRVYGEVLTEAQIQEEYNLKAADFLVNEYTFESEDKLFVDNIRGYNISAHDADTTAANTSEDPEFVNGSMHLANSTAVLSKVAGNFGDPVNPNYLYGMSRFTFSCDIKIDEDTSFDWERIFDIFVQDSQRISLMAHTGGPSSSMNTVYQNNAHNNIDWMQNESTAYNLLTKKWYNVTISITNNSLRTFVDGKLISEFNNVEPLMEKVWNFEISNNSWFTLAAPVYEGNRYINACFDNIKIYATSVTENDMVEIIKNSRLYRKITIGDKTYQTKDSEEFVLEDLSKEGYSFIGYEDENGNIYKGKLPGGTGDVVLTPKFEQSYGSIEFNGGDGRGEMTKIDVTSSSVTLPEVRFVKDGYDFAGWATTSGGSVVYEDKATLTNVNSDIVLYAVFTARNYTITFDPNGGTGEAVVEEMTAGISKALTKNTFTRKGYVFEGWATSAYGIAEYTDEEAVSLINNGYDVTLYASWILKQITIEFDANGGSGRILSLKCDALEMIELPSSDLKKGGVAVKGWATSANGPIVYRTGDLVSFDEDVKLYAIYEDSQETSTIDISIIEDSTVDSTPGTSEEKKGGCGGDIIATSVVLSSLALLGLLIIVLKSKKALKSENNSF